MQLGCDRARKEKDALDFKSPGSFCGVKSTNPFSNSALMYTYMERILTEVRFECQDSLMPLSKCKRV